VSDLDVATLPPLDLVGAPDVRTGDRFDQRTLLRIALVVLGLQLVVLLTWSYVIASRDDLTWDFTAYFQAFYLIAHGHLNPYNTVLGEAFFKNDTELLMVPLAPLYWVWPHPITLLAIQDFAIVGSELVAWVWLAELLARRDVARTDLALLLALALLVLNPWAYWTASWDFHMEPLYTFFLLLTARALSRGRTVETAIWAACAMLGGVPGVLILAGVALGGLLMARSRRVVILACAVLAASGAWFLLATRLGGSVASRHDSALYTALTHRPASPTLGVLAVAKAMLEHPIRLFKIWWNVHANNLAMIGPAGIIGIAFGWTIGVVVFCFGPSDFDVVGRVNIFSSSSFQQFPVGPFIIIGTVIVLYWLARRVTRWIVVAVGALILAQAVAWAAVWIPVLPGSWLLVSSSAGQTLARANVMIPNQDEVVAAQGVSGGFAGRQYIYSFQGLPATVPVESRPVYFVVAPNEGIEVATVASQEALLTELANDLHAELVLSGGGVWIWRWDPPAGTKSVNLIAKATTLGAWGMVSTTGEAITSGPVDHWHLAATSPGAGYVEHGAYFRQQNGSYETRVTISTSGPVNVEVWNATGNILLARRQILATNGVTQLTIPFQVTRQYQPYLYTGWGPFRLYRVPLPPGNDIEVRVWSPGGLSVNVYTISMFRT
jgi:hypothetical protein